MTTNAEIVDAAREYLYCNKRFDEVWSGGLFEEYYDRDDLDTWRKLETDVTIARDDAQMRLFLLLDPDFSWIADREEAGEEPSTPVETTLPFRD